MRAKFVGSSLWKPKSQKKQEKNKIETEVMLSNETMKKTHIFPAMPSETAAHTTAHNNNNNSKKDGRETLAKILN